jgi:hypothetical protein
MSGYVVVLGVERSVADHMNSPGAERGRYISIKSARSLPFTCARFASRRYCLANERLKSPHESTLALHGCLRAFTIDGRISNVPRLEANVCSMFIYQSDH